MIVHSHKSFIMGNSFISKSMTYEELEFYRKTKTSANTIHTLSKLSKGEEMLISIWRYKKVYLFSREVTRKYRQINGAYKLRNNYDVNLKSKPLQISCTLTISSQCSLSIPLKILKNQRLILRWHLHGSKRLRFNCH